MAVRAILPSWLPASPRLTLFNLQILFCRTTDSSSQMEVAEVPVRVLAHMQAVMHACVHACRNQLYHNKNKLVVDLEHVRAENKQLAKDLETRPGELLPLVSENVHSRHTCLV